MSTVLASTLAVPMAVSVVHNQHHLRNVTPALRELLDRGTADHNAHKVSRKNLFLLEEQPGLVPSILLVWQGDKLICVAPFYEILSWAPA